MAVTSDLSGALTRTKVLNPKKAHLQCDSLQSDILCFGQVISPQQALCHISAKRESDLTHSLIRNTGC